MRLTRRRGENLKLFKPEKCNAVRNSSSGNYVEKSCLDIKIINLYFGIATLHGVKDTGLSPVN